MLSRFTTRTSPLFVPIAEKDNNITHEMPLQLTDLYYMFHLYMLKVVNNTTLVVLLTTFNIYKFHTHNGDDIP